MARTSVTTTEIVKTGVANNLVAADVANGEVIDTGRVFLEVTNTGSASATVTVHATAVVDGLNVEDLVVTVAAGATEKIGPLSTSTFGQPTSAGADKGRAYVDYQTGSTFNREVFSL